jgi:sarcosine oxidase subunit gamma
MIDERRISPLAHREPLHAGDAAHLAESPFRAIVSVRAAPIHLAAPLQAVTGRTLPIRAGEADLGRRCAVLWLGPDEWAILSAPGTAEQIVQELSQALAPYHHQVVDVSDYDTVLTLRGSHARDLLAKLITIDLHPRFFARGNGVATLCGKAQIWLICREDETSAREPLFEIVVRRSMADYLWCLIADAGREWAMPPQEPIGQVPLHMPR